MRFGTWLLFLSLLLSHIAWAQDSKRLDFNLEPRLDLLSGSYIQMQRALAKYSLTASAGGFQAYFEGLSNYDLVEQKAWDRRSRSETLIQEAYLELKKDIFFLRAGRQAIRWSDSWMAPSLDIWSGRRWNRLFFDPFSETLINPVGLRASAALDVHELDFFQSFTPVYSTYPKPLPNEQERWNTEWGARAKTQIWGFDLSAVHATKEYNQILGGSLSYAFDELVPKMEYGDLSQGDYFFSAGLDIFADEWTFHPQYNNFYSATQIRAPYQNQYFLAISYDKDPHKVEIQMFRNVESKSDFGSILYTRNLSDSFDLSFIYQAYRGQGPTLFGVYQNMTGDFVAGLRLTGHIHL